VTPSDKRRSVRASLGAGDDRFVGSGGSDYVVVEAVSPGADNISTGAGNDIVRSGAGWGPANLVVDLGAGRDDLVLAFAAGSSAQVQAGDGTDGLFVEGDPADYVFDLGTGLVTGSGVAMASLPGFENYEIDLGSTSGLRVLGTPGRDSMVLAAGRLDLALGDGPDDVFLDFGRSRIPAAGVLDLGPGEDSVQTGKAQLVVGDLVRGSLRLRTGTGRNGDLALVGVERLRTIAPPWCFVVEPEPTACPPTAAMSGFEEGPVPTTSWGALSAFRAAACRSTVVREAIAWSEAGATIGWGVVGATTRRWVGRASTPAAPNTRSPANARTGRNAPAVRRQVRT
jgi:hypothetical protein